MDDFGSGYSSLNQLKDMPIDVLKIDMKFLSKAQDENKSNTILRNVLRLSNDLGLLSLTEGVETESQYKMLLDMGCHLFQGYYFAKPMPLKDFEAICSKS
jgi:EAL domain-containing protein (putative c-di-GMP-specific phosphodiesterase class I)